MANGEEFSEADYKGLRKVCHHFNELKAFVSGLPEGKKTFLARIVLRPEPGSEIHSPLVDVSLCNKGHLDVVQYFTSEFEEHIDLNHGAMIRTPPSPVKKDTELLRKFFRIQQEDMDLVPPLVAACASGNLEVVEYLIEKGADPNKQAPYWGSPICIAAQYGCISIMEYLINKVKVDINSTNYRGCTPLMMTCGLQMTSGESHSKFGQYIKEGKLEMDSDESYLVEATTKNVRFLLQNGANVHLKTTDGYTVMHEATWRGRLDIVMALVLEGVSPLFSTGDSSEKNYVPCPLYLAAVNGHLNTVKYLCQLEECPPICKGNAYLLIGSRLNKIEFWEEALSELEKNDMKLLYPPTLPEYEYRKEISSIENLRSEFNTDEYSKFESHYQKLLIMERCLGLSYPPLVEAILSKHLEFRMAGKSVEGLFKRAFQAFNYQCVHCKSISMSLKRIFDTLLYITIGYGVLAGNCNDLRYIAEIGVLALQKGSHTFDKNLRLEVHTILLSLMTWYNYRIQADDVSSTMPPEFYQLLQNLIPLILYLPETTALNLLSESSNFTSNKNLPYSVYIEFVKLYLASGGSETINTPDSKDGMRPLHYVAKHKDDVLVTDLLSALLSNGAHLDAVDGQGKTALDHCSSGSSAFTLLKSMEPFPLSCIAARKIVSDEFPYNSLDLPKHIIKFIKLHDRNSIVITKVANRYRRPNVHYI